MKIHQLIGSHTIALTNEENQFVEKHNEQVKLTSLDEHEQWLAQGLVRKGIYQISKDSNTLVNNLNGKSAK
jgi:hypothetical protein